MNPKIQTFQLNERGELEWESDWYNSKGITFLITNSEEKNRNPLKKKKIIDSQVDSQRVHLRHDFSTTDGECTQYNFPHYFGFERVKKVEEENRNHQKKQKIWQIIL